MYNVYLKDELPPFHQVARRTSFNVKSVKNAFLRRKYAIGKRNVQMVPMNENVSVISNLFYSLYYKKL